MKKLITMLFAVAMVASTAFAKTYHGDIQFHAGIALSDSKAVRTYDGKELDIPVPVTYTGKNEATSAEFDLGLQTWHLFSFNDFFSLGFMVGFDFGVGGTTKMTTSTSVEYTLNGTKTTEDRGKIDADKENLSVAAHFGMIVGPAVGFTLGKVVRFDASVGLTVLAQGYTTKPSADSKSYGYTILVGPGVGFDLQAKFLPGSVVSPIVGYRFSSNFTDTLITVSEIENNREEDKIDIKPSNFVTNVIYLGLSINW